MKKLSDVVDKKFVKNTKFNTNMKVYNLEQKNPDASTLIQANHYNTDKQNLEKETGDVENKIPDISGLATAAVVNKKIGEVENKIADASKLVKKNKNKNRP